MRILKALKHKKARNLGILAIIGVAIVLPLIQTGFFQNSFSSWFLTLIKSPLNTSLFLIFSLLFGASISLRIYNSANSKLCENCNIKGGSKFGIIGVILGSLVGVCPACIGLLGLILPLGTSLALTRFGWVFMLIAIAIMIISIHFAGGFKKE